MTESRREENWKKNNWDVLRSVSLPEGVEIGLRPV